MQKLKIMGKNTHVTNENEVSMFSVKCNIDNTDRINRTVIGIALCLAVLIGLGKIFFMILGVILVVEGIIGWCSIPLLVNKIIGKEAKKF